MTDDRMETITDPAEIRATDDPDERTTPAPVGAAVALDLDALHETICDKFTGMAEVRQAADLLVAEVRSLRANWRMVTTALGYGDGITEPQIEHRDFVAECERQFAEASEWRESQRWRDECHEAGHPDDEDCYEHDPALVLLTLRAKAREGFPGMDPAEFVERFFLVAQGMKTDDDVTRIEWRYLDEVAPC